jgi:Type II CAAX prenyl endopeptidase Rce1-like
VVIQYASITIARWPGDTHTQQTSRKACAHDGSSWVYAVKDIFAANSRNYFIFTGRATLTDFSRRLVSNTSQNGPFEEFLFRGAIQSRLVALLGPEGGVVLSAFLYGLWHVGLGYSLVHRDNLPSAIASTVLIQTMIGLGLGVICYRTRNIVASSICHVIFNSVT